MATIRKRGNYQWEAQIRKRGFPSQTKTFNTKVEAEAWAKMIESEMARGVCLSRSEAESTTLYETLTRYERDCSRQKRSSARSLPSADTKWYSAGEKTIWPASGALMSPNSEMNG